MELQNPQPVYHPPQPAATLATLDLAGTFDESQALDLPAAAKLLRGRWGTPHVKVVGRWCTRGRAVRGVRLVLPSVLFAGRRLVMQSWLELWQRTCAAAAVTPDRPPPPKTRRRRARR